MKDHPRLPESELDIMLVIWDLGDQAAAPAILERLERPLTASALHSYLKRLEDKGYLTCTKEGKTNRYTPLVSREDYLAFDSRMVLSRLYGSSPRNFVAALAKGGLNQKDLEDLRNLLDELSGGESHE